jgi:hypothetical protein
MVNAGEACPRTAETTTGCTPSAPKLSSDRVAYVVQAGGGVHPSPSSEPPEPTGEGVRIHEEPVSAVAHEGDGTAELVDRVSPSWAKSRAPFQFFAPISPDLLGCIEPSVSVHQRPEGGAPRGIRTPPR